MVKLAYTCLAKQEKMTLTNDPNIEEGAMDIEENGVYVDEVYGNELLKLAINSVLLDVEKQLDSHYGY